MKDHSSGVVCGANICFGVTKSALCCLVARSILFVGNLEEVLYLCTKAIRQ